MKTELSYPLNKPMASWSWQDIQTIYKIYSDQLREYERQKNVFGFRLLRKGVAYTESPHLQANVMWDRGVKQINNEVVVLDQEIARRNNLIGVIG